MLPDDAVGSLRALKQFLVGVLESKDVSLPHSPLAEMQMQAAGLLAGLWESENH